MKYIKHIDFKVNKEHQIGFFNVGSKEDCFLIDFKKNQRITIQNDVKEYEIQDISNDGKYVVITAFSYANKERYLRIYDIATKELIFETNGREFFIYDVLFSSNPNMIIVRANIKRSTKVFIYNFKSREIVYTFPKGEPLVYGNMNFENHNFVLPNFRKKNEIIVFDFDTLTETIITVNCNKKIQRVEQIDKEHFLAIDSEFNAHFINSEKIIWTTKLDFDKFYYAPGFFRIKNRLVFEMHPFCSEFNFYLDLQTGKVEKVETPVHLGRIRPYFDDLVMDCKGTIFNLDTAEFSNFEIEKFIKS